jgi:glucose/arabinose dehydrogenase
VISRFTADAARTTILVNTEVNYFRFPKASLIHNGGSPIFGEDGYLYIPVGDGISFTENFVPYNTAPDMTKPNGKVLRIDVNNVPEGAAYGIPQDNPFVNQAGTLPEIFAYGLRNPWTLVYDAMT